jgi:hypothetical protein
MTVMKITAFVLLEIIGPSLEQSLIIIETERTTTHHSTPQSANKGDGQYEQKKVLLRALPYN